MCLQYNMKKLSILLLLVTFRFVTFGQVYQEMPQYGYRANRMAFDSTLQIPTFCGVPTLKSAVKANKNGAIAFDSCNNKLYQYNPKTLTWSEIGGGGNQNLQQVTDIGFYTTNPLVVLGGDSNIVASVNEDGVVYAKNEFRIANQFNNQFGSIRFNSSDTLLNTRYYELPRNSGYIPLSVNNNLADSVGNITIPTIDTTNQFVKSVASLNDSSIRVIKGTTTTDITIKSVTNSINAKRLVTKVYNNSGVTIARGAVVYINGRHSSNYPTILPAQANSEENSYKTFALVEDDIADKAIGYVVQSGSIEGLNLPTSTYTDGDIVYLSPTIAGGITNVKPLAPNHICKLGSVTRSHPTLGSIEVKIENGWQLDELSDVSIPLVPADSVLLQFSRVDSLWHDVTITNAIGNRYIRPSDTTSMLNPYARTNSVNASLATKLNASDTASLSNRINNEVSNLDILQLMSYGIKAEPYGITLANMSSQLALVANRFFVYPFNWNVSDTLRGVSFFCRSAFTNTSTNYNGVGIYSLSGGTLTRIVFTANNGTFWNSTANSWVSQSITPTFLTKGLYFIGYQYSGSVSNPTIGSGDALIVATTQSPSEPPSAVNTNGIKFSTFIANGTSAPPTSIAMSATTASANIPYFLLY